MKGLFLITEGLSFPLFYDHALVFDCLHVLLIQLLSFKQRYLKIFGRGWSIVIHVCTVLPTIWLRKLCLVDGVCLLLNIHKVLVEFDRLEFRVILERLSILVSQDHALMLLMLLLRNVSFHIHNVLEHLKIVKFLHFVNVLMIKGVFKHAACIDFHENVSRHIVRQVSKHEGPLSCFEHGGTWNFQIIKVSVDIHLAFFVVEDVCCWQDLAITLIEVEKGQNAVEMG